MAKKVAVINVVGLSGSLLPHAPRMRALGEATRLRPVLPAVTCSVQASMLTGLPVGGAEGHGIVGNGWFNRDLQEIQFWKQSNKLVHGEKVWETARRRDPSVTCAKLFWWYNMYSSADVSVTPRPQYRADGRKVPDCYSEPPQLRDRLQAELGRFPLFNFWGPTSNLSSSRWIADATTRVAAEYDPTLTLVYLPHLDYGLQKFGPDHPSIPTEVAAIDGLVGGLIDFFHGRDTRVLIVSEYGIEATPPAASEGAASWGAASGGATYGGAAYGGATYGGATYGGATSGGATSGGGAIAVNRYLRDAGLLRVRVENGRELLDAGASRAFAVADHQVAHVYHPSEVDLPEVPNCKATTIDHPRAGNTVLVADPGYWFTYDYWPADRPQRAPDFARTVDIHRKPGYDPRELFLGTSKATVMWKLMKKKLGFRQPLDVISLDASLVRGTHGRIDVPPDLMPVMIGAEGTGDESPCTAVRDVILEAMGMGG